MTETAQTPPYVKGPDEKVAQVMIYTANALYWGEVVVKEIIRVSTWLRTNTAPDRVAVFNARYLLTNAGGSPRPMQFPELHIATSQIQAFHLVPPAKDPPDYDPTEPNRRMQPVTLLVGSFRIEGHLRLASRTSVAKFLEVTRENFTTVYDAKISNPSLPSFGVIAIPFLIVRQETTVFIQQQSNMI